LIEPEHRIIDVRSLHKQFGIVRAVNGLSFTVRKGEVLCLLGPNGAGKTTTMKIITGFLPPTAGNVEICGHDILREPLAARRHIGYLPEGAPLYGEMTPAGLLDFVAGIRHMSAERRRERKKCVIDALELHPVLLRRIDTLSKGFKRRVGLAQALLGDPEVLILDEPTDGLDPNQKHHVRNLIRDIRGEKAIIISTHLLEEVDAVCDRAIIIDRGQIVLEGSREELHARAAANSAIRVRLRSSDGARAVAMMEQRLEGLSSKVLDQSPESWTLRVSITAAETQPIFRVASLLLQSQIEPLDLKIESGSLDDVFRRVTASSNEPTTVPA